MNSYVPDENIATESEFERDFHAYVILQENPGISWDEALRKASEEDREMREQDSIVPESI